MNRIAARRWPLPARALAWASTAALLLASLELASWALQALQRWSAPLPAFLANCLYLYLHVPFFCAVLVAVEKLHPGSGASRHRFQAMLCWACYVPLAVASAQIVGALAAAVPWAPLIRLQPDPQSLEGPLGLAFHAAVVVSSFVVFDFFMYWFHRLQHAVPALWAFHSSHHAIRGVSAVESYHHPLEDVFRIPFVTLPVALLYSVDVPRLALLSSFVTAWALFSHMDSSFSLGRIRLLFVDNHYHRIHHSLLAEHHNKNFAGFFSLWDRLFKTQYLPSPGAQVPPTGLADSPHPRSLADYLCAPLRQLAARRRQARATGGTRH
jgi:sterol desaturase/sphingolipid hydroxylase (fatty acid hydroxylase superfamily)